MPTIALIDCRPFPEYQLGHGLGACSIPATELFARLHELPKRSQTLQLCGRPEDLTVAREFLSARDYQLLEDLVWTEDLVQHLQTSGQWEIGSQSQQCWQAAPLWQRFVQEFMPRYQIPIGQGLDLACGAGRDLIYLAQQGWQMT
ncbi:MAG: hypothetical protein RLZZ215_2685, partial [Pseudomonadota bacterium]